MKVKGIIGALSLGLLTLGSSASWAADVVATAPVSVAGAVDIWQDPTAVGTPVGKRGATTVKMYLEAVELEGILDPAKKTTFTYWTYNSKVPGPMLRARVGALLEQKHLRDREQAYLRMIEEERAKSEALLLNILPKPIAERLKAGETIIADSYPDASVLFADLVDFTSFAGRVSAVEVVNTLNGIFMAFDELVEEHGLEKVKTTGDAYMVVGGLNIPLPDHAEAMADLALAMSAYTSTFRRTDQSPVSIRIGLNAGPVVAGVIGRKKFIYDLWGDTVNVASRMEAQGLPGAIQVPEPVYRRLSGAFEFQARGVMDIKGKGEMQTYLLQGRR